MSNHGKIQLLPGNMTDAYIRQIMSCMTGYDLRFYEHIEYMGRLSLSSEKVISLYKIKHRTSLVSTKNLSIIEHACYLL